MKISVDFVTKWQVLQFSNVVTAVGRGRIAFGQFCSIVCLLVLMYGKGLVGRCQHWLELCCMLE